MPSGGQLTYVKVAYSVSSPVSWTEIPEIFDVVSLPNRIRDRIETTVHGTSGDKTYIPGLSDVQEAEIVCRANLDSGSVHSNLRRYFNSQTTLWLRYEVSVDPDFSNSTFIAYTHQARLSAWELQTPKDDLKLLRMVFQHEDNLYFQEEMASAF